MLTSLANLQKKRKYPFALMFPYVRMWVGSVMKYVPSPSKGAKTKSILCTPTQDPRNPLTVLGTLSVLMERRDGLNSLVCLLISGRNAFALSVHTEGPKSTDPEECNRNNSHTSSGAHTIECQTEFQWCICRKVTEHCSVKILQRIFACIRPWTAECHWHSPSQSTDTHRY